MTEKYVWSTVQDQELVARRRAAICRAAVKLARQRGGFRRVSTREIAAEAGINIATMYQYIKAKEDILMLICQDNAQAIMAEANPDFHDPIEELQRIFHRLIEVIDSRKPAINLMYQESGTLQKEYLDWFKRFDEQAVDVFEKPLVAAVERGLIDVEPGKTRLLARHMLETGYHWAHKYWAFKHFIDAKAYADTHWKWFCRILGIAADNSGGVEPGVHT